MPTFDLQFLVGEGDDYSITVALSDQQFEALKADGAVTTYADAPGWFFDLHGRVAESDEDPFTADDVIALADALLAFPEPAPVPLDDTDAIHVINFILSAPEWAPSFLEDIADVVARTDHTRVKGAAWDSH